MIAKKLRITKNAVRCGKCLTMIESKHRHDFQQCMCGDVFVDGGHDYLRMGANPGATWEDLSDFEEVEVEVCDECGEEKYHGMFCPNKEVLPDLVIGQDKIPQTGVFPMHEGA